MSNSSKANSEAIISEILSIEEQRRESRRIYKKHNFPVLEVDRVACIGGKTGIVRKLVIVGKRLLVWLEIQIISRIMVGVTSGVKAPIVIHLGLELAIK